MVGRSQPGGDAFRSIELASDIPHGGGIQDDCKPCAGVHCPLALLSPVRWLRCPRRVLMRSPEVTGPRHDRGT